MNFDTSKNNGRGGGRGRRQPRGSSGVPDFSTGNAGRSGRASNASRRHRRKDEPGTGDGEDFRIPAGARKAALVHLSLAVWREGLLDPKELGEVRGRNVDEVSLQRALYRSSIGEIEHVLGPVVKGKRVVVEDTSPARDAPPLRGSAPRWRSCAWKTRSTI